MMDDTPVNWNLSVDPLVGSRFSFGRLSPRYLFAFTQSRRHSLPSSCTTRLASSAVFAHAEIASSLAACLFRAR